jgi:hypothetical protein
MEMYHWLCTAELLFRSLSSWLSIVRVFSSSKWAEGVAQIQLLLTLLLKTATSLQDWIAKKEALSVPYWTGLVKFLTWYLKTFTVYHVFKNWPTTDAQEGMAVPLLLRASTVATVHISSGAHLPDAMGLVACVRHHVARLTENENAKLIRGWKWEGELIKIVFLSLLRYSFVFQTEAGWQKDINNDRQTWEVKTTTTN